MVTLILPAITHLIGLNSGKEPIKFKFAFGTDEEDVKVKGAFQLDVGRGKYVLTIA